VGAVGAASGIARYRVAHTLDVLEYPLDAQKQPPAKIAVSLDALALASSMAGRRDRHGFGFSRRRHEAKERRRKKRPYDRGSRHATGRGC
jgi:hypothetical protein